MADNKKSFVLYTDLIHTVTKLPDDKAGMLFKHLLHYVNDDNPVTNDMLVEIAFEPIKQQLKRDLVKYVSRADRSRENGKLGGRPKNLDKPKKPSGLINNPDEPRKPDSVNDNVNDSVNVSVNDNVIKKETREIIFPFNSKEFMNTWKLWKEYKSTEHNFKYKSKISEQSALKKLSNLADNEETAIKILEDAMSNGYKGFFQLKNNDNGTTESRSEVYRSVLEQYKEG